MSTTFSHVLAEYTLSGHGPRRQPLLVELLAVPWPDSLWRAAQLGRRVRLCAAAAGRCSCTPRCLPALSPALRAARWLYDRSCECRLCVEPHSVCAVSAGGAERALCAVRTNHASAARRRSASCQPCIKHVRNVFPKVIARFQRFAIPADSAWRPCAGGEMAQLVSTNQNCRVVLMYPRGASQVQCSVCHTINCAAAVRALPAPFSLRVPSCRRTLLRGLCTTTERADWNSSLLAAAHQCLCGQWAGLARDCACCSVVSGLGDPARAVELRGSSSLPAAPPALCVRRRIRSATWCAAHAASR